MQMVYALINCYKSLLRLFQACPDELRKFAQISAGILFLIFKDHLFDAIETVEDEVRIHLGMQSLDLHFCKVLLDGCIVSYLPDPCSDE